MTAADWNWIGKDVACAVHDAVLAGFGGLGGIRDESALQSALARPRDVAGYTAPDAASLAAAYAWGILRNHPFADGNKRVAYALALLFLSDNGHAFTGTDLDSIETIITAAAGAITEDDLAAWFRAHVRKAR